MAAIIRMYTGIISWIREETGRVVCWGAKANSISLTGGNKKGLLLRGRVAITSTSLGPKSQPTVNTDVPNQLPIDTQA